MRDVFSMLTRGIKKRIDNILKEIAILDQQIPYFATAPGFNRDLHLLYTHLRNVKATLSDLLLSYLHKLENSANSTISLSKLIKLHLEIIRSHDFLIISRELLGHNSSIVTIIGKDYEKITKNLDETTDAQLRMVSLMFPYEFVLNMISDKKFIQYYFSYCYKYTTINNTYYVNEIFKLIQKYYQTHAKDYQSIYFTPDAPMFFQLAEHMSCFFNWDAMMDSQIDKLTDFQILQKCIMISKSGPQTCGLNQKMYDYLMNLEIQPIDVHYLRSIVLPLPDIPLEPLNIPALQHISFELRKIQLQCCPTEMLHCIANTLKWISDALTANGQGAGADEIFQFYVYVLTSSKLNCIQTLINFMEAFVYKGLKETKYPFLISQTKMALDFIDARMFSVDPYILFPFNNPPERLQKVIKLANENPVTLIGFNIIAFPTFSTEYEEFFPALINYTGEDDDIITAYQYKVTDGFHLLNSKAPPIECVATIDGTFFQLKSDTLNYVIIDDHFLREDLYDLINAFSLTLKSIEKIPFRPKLNSLNDYSAEMIHGFGKDAANIPLETKIIVAEMQRALVILGVLPSKFHIDGVFNSSTVEGIHSFSGSAKDAIISPKIYIDLIKHIAR